MHVQSANLADDSKLKSDQLYKVLKVSTPPILILNVPFRLCRENCQNLKLR